MISDKPICVTGASGFIASYIVKELLAEGYSVCGTVRKATDGNNYDYLKSLPGADERLRLVQADLLTEGAFDSAVEDCEYVIHTASPYFLDTKNPQRDLVDPALKGTLNVLRACAKSGTVKKVVLTSSEAAIYDSPVSGHVYTEKDWNKGSSLSRNPYHYSKTVAEHAAWEFIEKEKPGFQLVTINPSGVIGESLSPSLNTSNGIFRDLLAGKHPIILDISFSFVNVRDVAHAHVLAMENTSAQGRYICTGETLHAKEIVDILREGGFKDYKLPKARLSGRVGNALGKFLAASQPKGTRTFIRSNIGRRKELDASKIRQELGMTFRPVKEAIIEATKDVIHWKHI